MTRDARYVLLAWIVAICFATGTSADIAGNIPIPDPSRGWESRNLSPVEEWLAAVENNLGERDDLEVGKSVSILRAQAWLARREGESNHALDLIDRAIDLAPDRPDLRVDRAAFRADRLEDSGAFKSLRIARDVRRDLEHALKVMPEHIDALAALAAFHLRAPGIAGGDRQEAAALLARLGELAPSHRWFREAVELADDERFAEAVDSVALALSQADGPRPNWRIRMGDWLRRLDRDDAALEAYREALSGAPQHAGALYAFGRTAAESGLAIDTGIDTLQRFLALPRWPKDPEPKLAWWQLGRLHARAGCVDRAETAFRRALALDRDWREPRRSLQRLGDDENLGRSCDSAAEQPSKQGSSEQIPGR